LLHRSSGFIRICRLLRLQSAPILDLVNTPCAVIIPTILFCSILPHAALLSVVFGSPIVPPILHRIVSYRIVSYRIVHPSFIVPFPKSPNRHIVQRTSCIVHRTRTVSSEVVIWNFPPACICPLLYSCTLYSTGYLPVTGSRYVLYSIAVQYR
jgi:hypothetical protein